MFLGRTIHSISRSLEKRIFSGIQPTGIPHLGNYFGAIEQWVKLLDGNSPGGSPKKCSQKPIFCIVDIHAYSSPEFFASSRGQTNFGQQFHKNILTSAASLIALGLDPSEGKCILFKQSDVHEHNYLASVFENLVTIQRLSSMIQFKEKRAAGDRPIPVGLLTYPVLQAADILLYRANLIPVGEDQTQHLELTRDIASKFNKQIAGGRTFFDLPEPLMSPNEHGRRIKSLRDPDKKMSKSDPNKLSYIQVTDEPEIIIEKCKKALTDSDSRVLFDQNSRPGVSNLIRLYELASNDKTIEEIETEFAGSDTGRFKLALADLLIERFKPVRLTYKQLNEEPAYLESILKSGAHEARQIAAETVRLVRHELGSQVDAQITKII